MWRGAAALSPQVADPTPGPGAAALSPRVASPRRGEGNVTVSVLADAARRHFRDALGASARRGTGGLFYDAGFF